MSELLKDHIDQITIGRVIDDKYLTNNESGYAYLRLDNVDVKQIIISDTLLFITDKNVRKYYDNVHKDLLLYGDYLLFRKNGTFGLLRYQNEINHKVIPNQDFIVIKSNESYLINALREGEDKRKYFLEQVRKNYEKYNEVNIDFVRSLENTTIPTDNSFLSNGSNKLKIENLEDVQDTQNPTKQRLDIDDVAPNHVITDRHSIYEMIDRIEKGQIDLQTEFQRQGNLWEKDKQVRLIESILLNLPIPTFYFDTSDNSNWLIIDGLQRLSTIKNFAVDKNLKLDDLEFLTDFEGYSFDDLPTELQTKITRTNLNIVKIHNAPKRVKYALFERLNTSSKELTSQEIRHALNPGKPAVFVRDLAQSKEFLNIVRLSDKITKRMKDRELVLRFLAFKMTHYEQYSPNMKSFLNDAMSKIYDVSTHSLADYEVSFKQALMLAKDIFGNDAFKLLKEGKKMFNTTLFDSTTYAFSELNVEERQILMESKEYFLEAFQNLLENNIHFQQSLTNETKESVKNRFMFITKLTKEIILVQK